MSDVTFGCIGYSDVRSQAAVFEFKVTLDTLEGTHYLFDGRMKDGAWEQSNERGVLKIVDGTLSHNMGTCVVKVNGTTTNTVTLGENVIRVEMSTVALITMGSLFRDNLSTDHFKAGTIHYFKFEEDSGTRNQYYDFSMLNIGTPSAGWYLIPNKVEGVTETDYTDVAGWTESPAGTWTNDTSANLTLHTDVFFGGMLKVTFDAELNGNAHKFWYKNRANVFTGVDISEGHNEFYICVNKCDSSNKVHIGSAPEGTVIKNIKIVAPHDVLLFKVASACNWIET